MPKLKNISGGLLAGILGGMFIDLVYIEFAGPSALFTLIGLTDRLAIFWSHAALGGILGMIFSLIIMRWSRPNVWLMGVSYGLACLGFLGAVPSLVAHFPMTPQTAMFGFFVWIVFGLILAEATQNFKRQYG
ncbi:MAG: hypothetical protein Q7S70_03015 [bacterium]|nr:hypothetical protein [bacterium]